MTDTNPRVTILCAVSEIREFHAGDAFLMAVGDWLEAESAAHSSTAWAGKDWSECCRVAHALAVARAFLEKP